MDAKLQYIIEQCRQQGIYVHVAKRRSDGQRDGLHLLCPSVDELFDAVKAGKHRRIFLHNHFTYPVWREEEQAA